VNQREAKPRADEAGKAFAGSRLQVQIYVNRHRSDLNAAVSRALPSLAIRNPELNWVSPLEERRFAEYHDTAFLEALGFAKLAPLLRSFWPAGGPHWDALAIVRGRGDINGVLLAEGKSYPDELRGGGMAAKADASRETIDRALKATQEWLTVPDESREAWTGQLYQSANRLAHLFWFRNVAGVQAWLLHLLFTDDQHQPTSEAQWQNAIEETDRELGIGRLPVPHAGHAFLPALDSGEL
jgi:hypothetical protein